MGNGFEVLNAGEGPRLNVLGDEFICKTSGEESGGGWTFFEATVMPGSVVPDHKHVFDEAFYILEGSIEMSADGEKLTATPGSYINIKGGIVHGYHNTTSEVVRYLTWTHPSGIGHFFSEINKNVKKLPEDLGQMVSIAEKHKIEIMPPA